MERIAASLRDKIKSVEEAAALIQSGSVIGCSGFTLVGEPKAVPHELARQKKADHLTILTGASVGDALDGELTRAGLLSMRYPYQSNKSMRNAINAGEVGYSDMHLSHMPEFINRGGLHIDFALVECAAVTEDGVIPSAAVGASDCFLYQADQIILEVNEALPLELYGMHDIYRVGHEPIPLTDATQRIGTAAIPCDFRKIAAIVVTNDPGGCPVFKEPDEVSAAIGAHIISFLKEEVAAGRQPASLSPIQSGVGSVANAVLAGLGSSGFTGLRMYTEVVQDSALELIWEGKMAGASTTAVSLSQKKLELFYENIDFFRERLVIRPQEIANNPELVRRLGLISMNTPIECDLYGNVNSTHIMGNKMMNGIGGAGLCGLIDRQRPGQAEANDHDELKNLSHLNHQRRKPPKGAPGILSDRFERGFSSSGAAPDGHSMDSSTAPDLTLSPTETSTSLTTPSFGQGMGCSIFMASIVPRLSRAFTVSPGLTLMATMVPGMRALISIISSSLNQISLCIVFTPCLWW